jgi:hypothetical protein
MQVITKIYTAVIIIMYCALNVNTAYAQRAGANGDYILSSINLEDNSVLDSLQQVPVFEDASMNCLLNSQWEFSRGEGYYKINNKTECTRGTRQIAWKFFNMKGSNYFQFVRTTGVRGVRADEHNIYTCEVQSSDKNAFTLRYPILFADKPNAMLFTFTRQQSTL